MQKIRGILIPASQLVAGLAILPGDAVFRKEGWLDGVQRQAPIEQPHALSLE